MKVGYARVSTVEQNLDLQERALKIAGCDHIETDQASGSRFDRPGLVRVLKNIKAGDTLVVWRLDRLGRSLKHLIDTVEKLKAKGVHFASLQESIDTSTAGGELIFHVMGALAQFERKLIIERTMAGLAAARARGRVGGRRRKLTDEKVLEARRLIEGGATVGEAARSVGCARATLTKELARVPVTQVGVSR